MSGLFAGSSLERPVTCEHCGLAVAGCRCPRTRSGRILFPKDQPARVSRETAGRRGKTVTVVRGLDTAASDLPGLLKKLSTALGTGGTIGKDDPPARGGPRRDAVADTTYLELRGDHREKVAEILRSLGYPVKLAGG